MQKFSCYRCNTSRKECLFSVKRSNNENFLTWIYGTFCVCVWEHIAQYRFLKILNPISYKFWNLVEIWWIICLTFFNLILECYELLYWYCFESESKFWKTSTVPVYFSRGRNLNETSELSFPTRLSLLKRDYNRSLRSQTKMSKKQIPFNILREFWGKIYTSHNFTLETHDRFIFPCFSYSLEAVMDILN